MVAHGISEKFGRAIFQNIHQAFVQNSSSFRTGRDGKSTDAGNLGESFAMLSGIVLVALVVQLYFLRPKASDFEEI